MSRSSVLGRETAPGLGVVTVFNQEIGSQSTIRSVVDRLDRVRSARRRRERPLTSCINSKDDLPVCRLISAF